MRPGFAEVALVDLDRDLVPGLAVPGERHHPGGRLADQLGKLPRR